MSDYVPKLIAKIKRTEVAERKNLLRKSLDRMLRGILELSKDESMDHTVPFNEMGLNSISGIKFMGEIADNLGEIEGFGVNKIIDHPSIDALTEYIAGKINLEEI